MPATAPSEREGFSLDGMEDLVKELVPGFDVSETPGSEKQAVEAADKAAEETLTGETPEGEETPAVTEAETSETAAAEETPTETEEEKATREAAEAAAAAPAETEEQKTAREATEAAEKAKQAGGDKDLEGLIKREVEPHTRPRTRKVITTLKEEAVRARQERDRIAQENAALKQKVEEAATKPGNDGEVEKLRQTITQLQDRIKEVYTAEDPEVVGKFDTKIKSNRDLVISTLKEYGLGTTAEGKDAPEEVTDLLSRGLTLKNLKPFLDKMVKAGEDDAAELIKQAVLENFRLSRDRTAAVQEAKTTFDTRQVERTKAQQQASQQFDQQVMETGGKYVRSNLEELTKSMPFLRKPEAPKSTDAPAVAEAKRKAIVEWEGHDKAIREEVVRLNEKGKSGTDAVEARSRTVGNAILSIVLRKIALPRLQRDLAGRDARIKQLETDLAKYRKAGALNGAHAAAAATNAKDTDLPPASMDTADAMREFAKRQGIAV